MTYNEFKQVVEAFEAAKAKAIAECSDEPAGIYIVYVNASGVERKLTIRNARPSSRYANCIEADCFSYNRANEYGLWGGPGLDCAITSHRTFSLSRIISASVDK